MSKENVLLLDEAPLVILPQLAIRIGLNEAIVLQQMHYWLKLNEKQRLNFRDGRYWTFNTYEGWQKQFPFWSVSTIRRSLAALERAGIIVVGCYNSKGYDNTKWYSIDYDVLQKICLIEETKVTIPSVQNEQATCSTLDDNSPLLNLNSPSVQIEQTHLLNLNRPIPEIKEETIAERNDSLRSSGLSEGSTPLSKESKHVSQGKNLSVDEAIEKAMKLSMASHAGKKQVTRKVPENAVSALRYFTAGFQEKFGGVAPLELEKDRKLMKQLVEHYGYATIIDMMDWMYRNWAKFRRECDLTSVPTIGLLYGFRGYLQEQVMAGAGSKDTGGEQKSAWGV